MPKVVLKDVPHIVPHRYPMLMIDSYSRIDDDTALSEKTFQKGDYGCENGVVIDSILVECVAQTVAAHYGYKSLMKKDENPGVGMLVSVDTFDFYHRVMETSKIDVFISKTDKIGAFKLFKGKIQLKNKLVAAGNIKVFNPEEKDE